MKIREARQLPSKFSRATRPRRRSSKPKRRIHDRSQKDVRRAVAAGARKTSKRLCQGVDRLSNLPDSIAYHILSFLDTKSAVQTSLLSKQWEHAWKQVQVLDIYAKLIGIKKLKSYVDKVLSRRDPLICLRKVELDVYLNKDEGERALILFANIVKYALSHGTRHLAIHLDCWHNDLDSIIGSIPEYCSLETLELTNMDLSIGFLSSGFRRLTRLELTACLIVDVKGGDKDKPVDPFSRFPCLQYLSVQYSELDDNDSDGIIISGLQLLSLDLRNNDFCSKVQIHAPKLKSFNLVESHGISEYSRLILPSLEQAAIYASDEGCSYDENKFKKGQQSLISVLRGVRNATSLKLSSFTIKVLSHNLELLAAEQACPFTRLQSLIFEIGTVVPDTLLNYFQKASSSNSIIPTVSFESFPKIMNSRRHHLDRHHFDYV
ncbi:FBD-associated F-box protein At5g60610 [Linum grandiflorum]